ncbi:MAG: hypothetical protein QN168_09370 [Armatimonadota bacterium]|nr:hypothetical protein [Armatimonadota bacterium]
MHPLAHILTGALVGQTGPSPAAAALGGLLSHLALDAIPHTDAETFGTASRRGLRPDLIEAGLELLVGTAVLVWLVVACPGAQALRVGLGALGGLAPDLIALLTLRFVGADMAHPPRLHWAVARRRWVWGVLTQAIVAAAAGLLLWRASGCP